MKHPIEYVLERFEKRIGLLGEAEIERRISLACDMDEWANAMFLSVMLEAMRTMRDEQVRHWKHPDISRLDALEELSRRELFWRLMQHRINWKALVKHGSKATAGPNDGGADDEVPESHSADAG